MAELNALDDLDADADGGDDADGEKGTEESAILVELSPVSPPRAHPRATMLQFAYTSAVLT